MTVDITFDIPCGIPRSETDADARINRQLYLLATAAQQSNIASVSIRVTGTDSTWAYSARLGDLLWPITRFGLNTTVTLSGVPKSIMHQLHRFQYPAPQSVPELSGWLQTRDECTELVNLVQKAGLKNTGAHFLPYLVGAAFRRSTEHVPVGDKLKQYVPEELMGHMVSQASILLRNERWRQVKI